MWFKSGGGLYGDSDRGGGGVGTGSVCGNCGLSGGGSLGGDSGCGRW